MVVDDSASAGPGGWSTTSQRKLTSPPVLALSRLTNTLIGRSSFDAATALIFMFAEAMGHLPG
jgi:hypothetical protein